MASIRSSPFWNTRTIRPESSWGNSEVLIDWLSIVEIDKVIHVVKTNMVKHVVDVESVGKSSDEIDKDIVSFGEWQLEQEDWSCVYASNKLYLHAVHVVPSKHESDQHW
ncbi:hypothetical protein Tco_0243548 [Tanacetum coccineum]